ncbi:MAG: hypothetical protein R2747_16460 [Pyrinomonadaceae bacterium]
MTRYSKIVAGVLLITVPTIVFGGTTLLSMLVGDESYMQNALRQNLWRAGHAHAGVLVIFSLIVLRYVDETNLGEISKWLIRFAVPSAAILMPLAFFLSVLSPQATAPNGFIYLAYIGALAIGLGTLTLGIGLIRAK